MDLLTIIIQILSVLMRLAHGKLCRVLFGNDMIGTQVSDDLHDLMDELDEAFFTTFQPEDADKCQFGDFAGRYRVAWTDEYHEQVTDAFHRYYAFKQPTQDGVSWEDSAMRKRMIAELAWCPGYANKGRPLAHNIPFLCSTLISCSAATLVQFPASIGEVSSILLTFPSHSTRYLARDIADRLLAFAVRRLRDISHAITRNVYAISLSRYRGTSTRNILHARTRIHLSCILSFVSDILTLSLRLALISRVLLVLGLARSSIFGISVARLHKSSVTILPLPLPRAKTSSLT